MSLVSKIASLGIGEILSGAGKLAKDIRYAITGEITQEKKAEIQEKVIELDTVISQLSVKEKELQANVVIAEAKGESWLQRNWRPLLMLCCIIVVANNYIILPYLELFGVKGAVLSLPDNLWDLMKIGVGGYIVGRTGEKIVEKWKSNGD